MGAPAEVKALVEKYRRDAEFYRSAAFKEMPLRSEFLNPILKALGWDPDNVGLSAARREVIQEDTLTIDGAGKAPDYAFVLERKRMFFLEAKRPSVNISSDRAPAYQIRRYSWNAGLPIGIVTDFEEWAVYDCRAEPSPNDPSTTARIAYFDFEQLNEKWEYLENMFARDSVASGSLSRYSADRRLPRGTLTVDQAFLKEINSWRNSLAVDLAKGNSGLDVVDLNAAVQTFIDRIIFLRIAEARGLEEFGELKTCADASSEVYRRLWALFRRADDRYNSGLFHFHHSSDERGEPDRVAPGLKISDHVLRQMIKRLYHPFPYEFSVMPADILGRVYEQFLGATISLEGRRAVVQEKPEVRKAGGVYYTPVPIVDYIVETTIGPLVKGASPGEVAKLRIVDPACGSGSFLIAAFQFLIDWYTAYYVDGSRNQRRYLERTPSGGLRLKTEERKRILLNNIHGVDIDPQAVEVTKLSLLLKVIEGQTQMELAVGRILPDLGSNIRCGNSIIDVDFPLPMGLTEEERLKFNPFDWHAEFPSVFRAGGFDALVGNPPYLNVDSVWGKRDPRLAYIKSHYSEVHTDKTDILFYFLVKATEICKGEIGMIVSRSFLEADKAQKLRGWLATHTKTREVLDFRHAIVFPKVGINTAIVRMTGSKAVRATRFRRYRLKELPPGYLASHLGDDSVFEVLSVPVKDLSSASWVPTDESSGAIIKKIDAAGTRVDEVLHCGKGMETGSNTAFVIPPTDSALLRAARSARLHIKRARNSDISAFYIDPSGPELLYVEGARSFASLPQEVQRHLKSSEYALKSRAAFKRGNCDWWRYTWPLHSEFVAAARIICPYRSRTNRFAVDPDASYLGLTDTTMLYDNTQPEDLRYIAAVLNSSPLTYRFRFIGKLLGGGTYEYFDNTVGRLPVPRRSPGDPEHDALVTLADEANQSAQVLVSTKVPAEKAQAQQDLADAMRRIDDIVYKMVGITSAERLVIRQALDAD